MKDLSRRLKTVFYSTIIILDSWCGGDTTTESKRRVIEQERAQAEQSALVGESYNHPLRQEIERSYGGRK